ncbi:hypothetical protein QLH32_05070 [Acinetobacter corruptisaponis]|uniref:Uncharacterized protein n=1 Tax=Acinetobacter corruptisaponis TaxID=3045147 RepID=A0ABY8S696_9GAMM|nr:hypothetical protein [Acinetobacter sp. KCTC 92772]WHP06846.1 hypothetical protein QLH32_05070 [Acinetobacter sp. KCTC 92772]
MWFLIFIGVAGLAIYFLNQNKTERKDQTTITHKKVIQTPDGEIRIERRQVIDSVRTSYTTQDVGTTTIKDIQPSIPHKPVEKLEMENKPETPALTLEPSPKPEPVLQQDLFNVPQSIAQKTQPKDPEKLCPKCEESLPFSAFSKSSKHEDGLTKWCTDCLNQLNEDRKNEKSNKKQCPNCKRTRLKTSFYKNTKRDDGLTKWCKDCMDKAKR